MKNMKRFLALLIAGALCTSGLMACGGKETSETSATETSTVEETVVETTEEETEEVEKEIVIEVETETETTEEETVEVTTEEVVEETTEAAVKDTFQLSDVQPIIVDGHYQYNPYLLSKEAIENYDMGFLSFYKDFVTAYMNYETECTCTEVDYAKHIPLVIGNECAFFSDDDIVFEYDYDHQRVTWEYLVDKETLDERIRKVTNEMQNYLSMVSSEMDEVDKVQTLYHAFCPLMTYNDERAVSREKISGCYAFSEHQGICLTFANAFAELLSQVDIDASTASGATEDDQWHVWNVATINGQNYFFDTTFEMTFKEGTAYAYYGMSMDERVQTGVLAEGMNVSRYFCKEYPIAEIHLNVR